MDAARGRSPGHAVNADLQARAKAIFADAIETPAHERSAVIDCACAGDERLRRAVEGLLAAHQSADRFLAAPTLADPDEQRAASIDRSGETLGRYRLVRPLGEGGFGEVYLAEQLRPVTRIVAVKLLRDGFDSRRVVARFEAERQALALMDHPCIASVLDAGATESGRPYFVMEYVQGEPITTWCIRKRLGVEARLRLFERVCLAVQHAHQKGVLHRDLKPSNVLVTQVDGEATPKVIDFGVAKAIEGRLSDQTIVTEERSLIGTPAYMSPEQASMSPGSVDTRSDVYSLGVLLYELLTDSPPFPHERLRAATFNEFQQILAQEEPERPSARLAHPGAEASDDRLPARRVRGELDWIVLRALEKDRTRRYQSAGSLAADVRRFLTGAPVEAGPPSRVYRTRKFVRRHRVLVGAASVVALALVVGLATALAGLAEARRQRNAAVVALEESRYLVEFLTGTISSVEPGERGRDTTVAAMLDDAAVALEAGFAGRPTTRATMHLTLGNAYMALGQFGKAERQFRAALPIRDAELGETHPDAMRVLANIAGVLIAQERLPEALVESERALARYQRSAIAGGREAIGVMGNHAALLERMDRSDEAVALRRRVLSIAEDRLAPGDEVRLAAKLNLAILLGGHGGHEEAIALLEENLDEWEAARGPEHPGAIMAADALGMRLADLGRVDEAAQALRSTLERRERALGPEHPDTLRTRINLGNYLRKMGQAEEGVALLRAGLDGAQRVLGPGHAVTMGAVFALGDHADNAGWETLDLPLRELIVTCLEAGAGSAFLDLHQRNAAAYTLVTIEPRSLRRPALALAVATEATRQARATGRRDMVYFLDTLGLALLESNRAEEAVTTLDEALAASDILPEELRAIVRAHRDAAAQAAAQAGR